MKADLHLHSLHSDGKFSPSRLIGFLRKKEIGIASLADHDSVKGLRRFISAANKNGIYVIPAVELSSHLGKKEIHILGYCIDYRNTVLTKKLEEFKKMRKARIEKMMDKLKAMGFTLALADVRRFSKRGLFGRMHLALTLVEKGYSSSVAEAFARFLGHGRCAFVPKQRFSPKEAVDLIKKAGGIPVIAHPGSPKLSEEEIDSLVSIGIKGLEAVHPKHSRATEERIRKICEGRGLLVTGGSDFHGHDKAEFDNLGSKCVNLIETCNLKHLLRAARDQ